ncbi:histidine kinase [Fibrisoma limi BUZ 3]|uniref:histidine kinase n=1 Tax=Fibrisoma limi BUZ 3 TaxID=1185876 RepID=I2GQD6_9BACT|nr:HAMP domain-containing sensor histidine kinase [Fibrisoma limi]CCH56114.1 histidine kinase [Fibrisoma limi BUZ 3]
MNIRTRLSVNFLAVVAANVVLLSLTIYATSAYYRRVDFYNRLADKAKTTARLLIEVSDINERLLRLIDRYNLTALPEEQITVFDQENRMVYQSDLRPDEILETPTLLDRIRAEELIWMQHNERQIVGLTYPYQSKEWVIVASAYDEYGLTELYRLQTILVVGTLFSLTLMGIMGWINAGRTLRPIKDVVQQVDAITISKLDKRVRAGNDGDEIAQLATTFNRLLDRVQSAFDMQRSFVTNASHELRTPLTVITGQIETTLIKRRTVEEHEAKWRAVLETIHQINKLANGLLQLAQVSIDEASKTFRDVSVDEVVYQAARLLTTRQPDFQVAFLIQNDAESEPPDLTILGDESLLTTAFLNLMENACKFSPNKKVEVTLKADSRWVSVRFKDQGIGISETDLPHIFEPFFRAESVRHIKGHGIGLPLTQRIVQLHAGRITVLSEVNHQTIFTIRLPKL